MINNCKICGHHILKHIGIPSSNQNIPRIKEKNYKIVQCINCMFYFIQPTIDLSQNEWEKLYNKDYFSNSSITKWKENLHKVERSYRISLIESKLKINKDRFLDMGCGEGYVLNDAYQHGFDVYGVDIANNIVNKKPHITFYNKNIFEVNFPDNFFSAIYMDSVLEHIEDPIRILNELYRILKPGGVILIIVPNEDSQMNELKKILYRITFKGNKYSKIKPFKPPYHINGFNTFSLKKALQISNFKSLSIKGFGGNYKYWKACKLGTKNYFFRLIIYPLELISIVRNKQIQLLAIAQKEN
jgi:ubiquinone/menaquinone biosynthesis C-methylase UbiE